MLKFYSGIGSRETPEAVLKEMTETAAWLESKGYILRSGGADGADQAFEAGVDLRKHIYLPWGRFCGNSSYRFPAKPEAFEIASKHHPAWPYLKHGAKALHARNVHQVLGDKLDTPSDFVLCWTKDGAECREDTSKVTGGTGGAIRLADSLGVVVINMYNPGWKERLLKAVGVEDEIATN